jgi:orotate phosphoribosyltransferase
MTDGGSKFNFIRAISEVGAKLNAIFVIFNYGINYDYLIVNGKKIKVIYLSTWKDVIQTMIENKLYKTEDIRTVIDFLESIGVKNLKFSL